MNILKIGRTFDSFILSFFPVSRIISRDKAKEEYLCYDMFKWKNERIDSLKYTKLFFLVNYLSF